MNEISLAYKVAYNAGFRGDSLLTALAIAGAESGFNSNAVGDENLITDKWGPSYGYWQIRSLTPDYLHLDKWRDENKLLSDPYFQGKAAYSISNAGKDFSPWSAYKNGNYKNYLAVAKEYITSFAPDSLAANTPNGEIKNVVWLTVFLIIIIIIIAKYVRW